MSTVDQYSGSSMALRPVATVAVHRGCDAIVDGERCGSPHPCVLACDDITICPKCGAPVVAPGEPMLVDVAPTGLMGLLFHFLMWCAKITSRLIALVERL